ncbi:hypothetical protein, partial [Shigella flexneri]|uniref:hypothetical protein n=1 Tax=Shigella flexneri TaxID=623 RepID=UPI000470C098
MNTNEVSVINLDQLVSMSSYDFLTKVINPARVEAGEKPVRNNDFVSRIEDELDGQNVAYEIFVSFGQDVKSYTLNTDQLLLVGMRESKAVRRKVLAYTGATPTEVIKALDLKLTSSKMLTASVLTGYLKTLCRPNPFYTKRVTEFGTTDIDLSTGRPRAIFNKKGETNGYYRLQPQPNDKEPTIKILRKGYDWLKDNWKDIAHDMRTSNMKWSTKTGHRVRVFPVSIFRFV